VVRQTISQSTAEYLQTRFHAIEVIKLNFVNAVACQGIVSSSLLLSGHAYLHFAGWPEVKVRDGNTI
jgi:hypothetical protein